MCVARGLCDHIHCGFTDKLTNYDVLEQCITLRAKVQVFPGFQIDLTCFAASVLCRRLVAYQSNSLASVSIIYAPVGLGKKTSTSLVNAASSATKHPFIISFHQMLFWEGFKGISLCLMGLPFPSNCPLVAGSPVLYKYVPLRASIKGATYSANSCISIL